MIRKVLVIEDEPSVRDAVCFILEQNGYEVVTAADGLIGVELFRRESPDLVVCDIMMPRMGGFEVLEAIRADDERPDLPVIMLTAKDQEHDLKRGYEHGADYYITKPFTHGQLLAGLELMENGDYPSPAALRAPRIGGT